MRFVAPKLVRGLAVVRNDLGEVTEKVDGIWTAVTGGVQEVRYAMEEMRGGMNHIESSLYRARKENLEYFKDVSSRLDEMERSMRKQQVGGTANQLLQKLERRAGISGIDDSNIFNVVQFTSVPLST